MNKTVLAVFFSIIFSVLTIAPNIFAIVDDNYDISILIDTNEEEEKKGEEKVKDLKIKVPSRDNLEYASYFSLSKLLNAHSDNYNSLFKELTSPPPETNI
jgi:hypothetical protein